MQIKIADIVFSVPTDKVSSLAGLEDSYKEFSFSSNDVPHVTIHGHYTGLPDIAFSKDNKVFDSGTFWEVFRTENQFILILKAPAFGHIPYCVAVFDASFSSGDVYFHSSYPEKILRGLNLHPLAFPIFHLLMISVLGKGYGVLVHACGIDVGGRGYLFPGSATYGKTTMARLWEDEGTILNDERVILRQCNGQYWIFGTPWHGEYEKFSPRGVQLERIYFLKQAPANSAAQENEIDAASKLLSHCLVPLWDRTGMNFVLDFCTTVAREIPCYELGFLPDRSVIDFIRCMK